jgi:(4S)-4-hydroxy-5-phosphonooxypentane-2,3-dione isomerase
MYGLIVSLKVKPEMRDAFLRAAEDDSICSVRDEPGCLRFDVLQDREDPDRYYFYEVYRDEAAFQAHLETPHYARWRDASEACLAEPGSARRCQVLFPREYR